MSRPEKPRPKTWEELDFEPARMVRWLAPIELIQTGIRKVVSETFGDYADKREMQAALDVIDVETGEWSPASAEVESYPRIRAEEDPTGVWIDYVSDLGDGFRATYTIAYLLAQERLQVESGPSLPRGEILIMGGDQVYPTPTRERYENNLIGPYNAALPEPDFRDGETAPRLYAVPGNHDWYDGLANFLRVFCARRRIGGWQTVQKRSYFAAKLPHHWWLWGIDLQFAGHIDVPQRKYFDAQKLDRGDRVLLVTGKPSWTHAPIAESRNFENLRQLEEEVIEAKECTVPAMISGDTHHYAHYYARDGNDRWRRKMTAGGGGAFLSATHHLRRFLKLPRGPDGEASVTYTLERAYPSTRGSWLVGLLTPPLLLVRNLTFAWALAAAYLVPALLLQSQATQKVGQGDRVGLGDYWREVMLKEWVFWAALVIVGFLVLYAAVKNVAWRWLVAVAHAVPHVLVIGTTTVLAAWGLDWVARRFADDNPIRTWIIEGDLAVALVGTALAIIPGAVIVGLYLIVMDGVGWLFDRFLPRPGDRFPRHVMELFAAQRITGYKNFLRLHIDGKTGALTIYPIAVPKAARFEFPPASKTRGSLLVPKEPIEWKLIEQPIVFEGRAQQLADLGGVPVE